MAGWRCPSTRGRLQTRYYMVVGLRWRQHMAIRSLPPGSWGALDRGKRRNHPHGEAPLVPILRLAVWKKIPAICEEHLVIC
jgi:hypothetical protein